MPTEIPATRQSIFETMSCETSYKLIHIDGLKPPSTGPSYRGTDCHDILADLARHCAQRRVPADYAYLDSLLASASPEVVGIMETCRENLTFDWENFFAAEISAGLDKDFQPTWSYDHDGNRIEIDPVWGLEGSGKPPAYCVIFDTIYLMPGGTVCRLPDYKTHPRPFPADTFQGKLYSLVMMMFVPELTEVEFGLKFIRYANKTETHKYYRSDVPQMMEDVRRVRNRQREIHAKVEAGMMDPAERKRIGIPYELRTHGGSHCTYCPCVLDPVHIPCPIARLNPMTNLSPAERLNWRLVHDVMNRTNNQAMQQYVDGSGQEIHSQDANGKHYSFGPVEKEKTTYPVFADDGDGGFNMPIIDALLDWQNANPADLVPKKGNKPWFLNLRIGSTQLKQYLKAKKREIIDNRIKDLATTETKFELRISRDAEVDDARGEEYREYDDDISF
jgi:hypothetical protein